MDLSTLENSEKNYVSSNSNSNQLFIAETLDLPDDTFRMSLDNFSDIGENVTIGEREASIDIVSCPNLNTTPEQILTPVQTPAIETPSTEKSPPILETPKLQSISKPNENIIKLKNLLKLSLTKKNEDDIFVKPSPVTEIMSPARMLQFEVGTARSATPTMKRTIIDFDFFNKNRFEEYFNDLPKNGNEGEGSEQKEGNGCKEAAVITQANMVRHEIGYARQSDCTMPDVNSTIQKQRRPPRDN